MVTFAVIFLFNSNKLQLSVVISNIHAFKIWLDLQNVVLSPMTGSSIFCHKHQETSIHYQVSLPKWSSPKWSAFTGCFSLAHWQSIQVAWVLNGALVRRQRIVCDFKAPWSWMKTSTIILTDYELSVTYIKVYSTSSPSSDIFLWIPYSPYSPRCPPIIELTWYYHLRANLGEKNYLKLVGNFFSRLLA